MRCEECLPRLEEYVDGELDGRMIAPLTAHISICRDCASEVDELRREQAIYARYTRDVEVTPAQWNIVRARIEQEKDGATAKPSSGFGRRIGTAPGLLKQFRPAFVATLVLIAIGITAGLLYLKSRVGNDNLAAKSTSRDWISRSNPLTKSEVPSGSNGNAGAVASDREIEEQSSDRQPKGRVVSQDRKKSALNARRSEMRRPKQSMPDEKGQFDLVAADNAANAARGRSPEATGDFDFEIARHAERAQLLLRSFRNVRLSGSKRRLDISYEKEQSRRLLYQNIALRREALGHGDAPTAELLDRLEPILLDIANLPNRAKSRDIYSIEQNMEKREIVATLQVRTLVASN